jgi:hypothetical protein
MEELKREIDKEQSEINEIKKRNQEASTMKYKLSLLILQMSKDPKQTTEQRKFIDQLYA